SQVTFRYENDKPVAIDAVVLSTQHDEDVRLPDLREAVMETIIKPVLPAEWLTKDTKYHINPTGQFVIGGPVGDCGLTGRSMVVPLMPVLPAERLTKHTKEHIDPPRKFVVGGPVADCGFTGRKIVVDTDGGMARHGGGAVSGKDPSKVDRSAAYACRYVAKNIVAAGLADKCEIQVSYAIGVAEPTSISVQTCRTRRIDNEKLEHPVAEQLHLHP